MGTLKATLVAKSIALVILNSRSTNTPVCLFEDREECALGVKLLILSAQRHEPEWVFYTFIKNFKDEDADWLSEQPNVRLQSEWTTDHSGWNVKPSLLKRLLIASDCPVLWCDSDLILASPVSPILDAVDSSVFVASEEHGWGRTKGSRLRTSGWGFQESRPLANTVNSSFMRMDSCHIPLLDAWTACLSRPSYLHAQSVQWDLRPEYFVGDQDALTALLASSEYSHIPLYLLKNGRDIAQCFEEDGYTAWDRLLNSIVRRVPPLIHAQGGKPWKESPRAIYQQLSPYNSVAHPYVTSASLPSEWIMADGRWERLIDRITFGGPNLRGFLPALSRTSLRVWKHRPGWLRL